jgi:hypothetical protein
MEFEVIEECYLIQIRNLSKDSARKTAMIVSLEEREKQNADKIHQLEEELQALKGGNE